MKASLTKNSYAGFVDGQHWADLLGSFEYWAEELHQPHAKITAQRMADTANGISPDLVKAAFEIVEAEFHEAYDKGSDVINTPFWQEFDRMCESFAAGYQPKDATEFVKDLVARHGGS